MILTFSPQIILICIQNMIYTQQDPDGITTITVEAPAQPHPPAATAEQPRQTPPIHTV